MGVILGKIAGKSVTDVSFTSTLRRCNDDSCMDLYLLEQLDDTYSFCTSKLSGTRSSKLGAGEMWMDISAAIVGADSVNFDFISSEVTEVKAGENELFAEVMNLRRKCKVAIFVTMVERDDELAVDEIYCEIPRDVVQEWFKNYMNYRWQLSEK